MQRFSPSSRLATTLVLAIGFLFSFSDFAYSLPLEKDADFSTSASLPSIPTQTEQADDEINPNAYFERGQEIVAKGISYQIEVKSPTKTSNYTIFTKGDKVRLETKSAGNGNIIILNDGKRSFLYDPKARQARQIPNLGSFTAFGIPKYTPMPKEKPRTKLEEKGLSPLLEKDRQGKEEFAEGYTIGGKENKNGYPCQMLINPKQEIHLCLTEEYGLPAYLKKGDTVFNYTNIKKIEDTDSLFSLPKDVVIVK